MLAPKYRDVDMGSIEVRSTFKISGVGTIAGCYVTDGKVTRTCQIRVVRDGIVVAEDKIDSLKRFKDDVKEVAQGYECGIGLEKFGDIKEGDILEAFIIEEYRD
jgi:translation initiation factor IF-2